MLHTVLFSLLLYFWFQRFLCLKWHVGPGCQIYFDIYLWSIAHMSSRELSSKSKIHVNFDTWISCEIHTRWFCLCIMCIDIEFGNSFYSRGENIGAPPHVILKIYKVYPYTIYSWYSIGVDLIYFFIITWGAPMNRTCTEREICVGIDRVSD